MQATKLNINEIQKQQGHKHQGTRTCQLYVLLLKFKGIQAYLFLVLFCTVFGFRQFKQV